MIDPIETLDGLVRASREVRKLFNHDVWFRGQTNSTWKLRSRIGRDIQSGKVDQFYEYGLANKFRERAPILSSTCPQSDDHFAWLSLMQHHGLATRLLDWTESMLVAAYFAVEQKEHAGDSAIWVVDPCALNQKAIMQPIPLSPNDHRVKKCAHAAFEEPDVHPAKLPLAVVARETSLRMHVQRAVFTIHSKPTDALCDALPESIGLKITICQSFREQLRNFFAEMRLGRSTFFPDLDSLAIELTDPYGLRPHASR